VEFKRRFEGTLKQAASSEHRMTLMTGRPVTNISVHVLLSTYCLLHSGFLLGFLILKMEAIVAPKNEPNWLVFATSLTVCRRKRGYA
jgi:hypothetical protein